VSILLVFFTYKFFLFDLVWGSNLRYEEENLQKDKKCQNIIL